MKRLLFILAVMTVMTTTFAQKKSLVLYYSETGTTEAVALEIQKQTGADIEAVEAVVPYTSARCRASGLPSSR